MSHYLMSTLPLWWFYLTSLFLIGCFTVTLMKLVSTRQLLGKYKEALTEARKRRDRWKQEAQDYQDDFEAMRVRWEEEVDKNREAWKRIEDTEAGSADLVTALLPLLEQTDWTTGRWGGRLPELQSREAVRNGHVVMLRQAVSRLPAVAEMDPFKVLEGAAPEAWNALVNDSGVPEDQTLHFSAEGGVQRVSRPSLPLDWPK